VVFGIHLKKNEQQFSHELQNKMSKCSFMLHAAYFLKQINTVANVTK